MLAPGRNLVLIGMMGSGKTTVGRLLAAALERPFVDTDAMVEAEEQQTVAELFAAHGERHFRALEAAAIRSASSLRGQVVAVGGGAVLDPANVTNLRGTGDLVWLDAPVSALVMHLSADAEQGSRPLLTGPGSGPGGSQTDLAQRLAQMRRDRHDAYTHAATVRIDTQGRPPEVLADEVLAWARTQHGLLAREERA